MVADMVADMEVDMVAEIEVDKVADMFKTKCKAWNVLKKCIGPKLFDTRLECLVF